MLQNTTLQDYTNRRGELSAYGRAVNSATMLSRTLLAVAVVTSAILIAILLFAEISTSVGLGIGLALVCLCSGLYGIWRYANQHFVEPDLAFRKWLQQVCDGELGAKIDLPAGHRHFKELNFHTRNLAAALRQLSTDMESLVESQTRRLEYQKRVLELLFKLTSNMSGEFEEQAVLDTMCECLADWFGDARVSAYMLIGDELKRLAVGESAERDGESHPLIIRESDNSVSDVSTQTSLGRDDLVSEIVRLESTGPRRHRVRIPIHKGHELVGMIEVSAAAYDVSNRSESDRVLTTVSEQLGLFLTKNSAVENAHNARLLQERANLGAEIHDSLAQTLLATRYHTTMLRESLRERDCEHILNEVQHIEGMIGEANEEVRGLIREVRKPLSTHRDADSLQATIGRFRESSDIPVFLQIDNPHIRFTPREDTVVQRIVAEALTNARKYSNARTIRVYLRCRGSGSRSLLIEDDGDGFEPSGASGKSNGGDHIGLSIMNERAVSIGAIFSIDSEIGEGTRVSLVLSPNLQHDMALQAQSTPQPVLPLQTITARRPEAS